MVKAGSAALAAIVKVTHSAASGPQTPRNNGVMLILRSSCLHSNLVTRRMRKTPTERQFFVSDDWPQLRVPAGSWWYAETVVLIRSLGPGGRQTGGTSTRPGT